MTKLRLFVTLFLCTECFLSLGAQRFPDRSGRLAEMRQSVWKEWCVELAKQQPVSPLEFAPLADGRIVAWNLPDSLEPQAVMNFRSGTKGICPGEGWPCYLYLHGSGPRDSEWETGWKLAQRFADAPSAYVIPQIPNEGKWYRWWQRSKLWAWNHLLRMLLARPDVDASRLYLFGISEGAYGSQRLASYYADYFAAAGPMAGGEPLKNAPVENLGNLAFSFLTGSEDVMFYRNVLTQNTAKALDSIASLYPGKYHHRVEIIPGRARPLRPGFRVTVVLHSPSISFGKTSRWIVSSAMPSIICKYFQRQMPTVHPMSSRLMPAISLQSVSKRWSTRLPSRTPGGTSTCFSTAPMLLPPMAVCVFSSRRSWSTLSAPLR